MSYPQIVLDANVIVQALVRDLLLDADAHGLCRVRWTETILGEAWRTLIGDFGRDPAWIAAMTNDPKDRHVAAAAVRAGAEIATFNLRHFRSSLLVARQPSFDELLYCCYACLPALAPAAQ